MRLSGLQRCLIGCGRFSVMFPQRGRRTGFKAERYNVLPISTAPVLNRCRAVGTALRGSAGVSAKGKQGVIRRLFMRKTVGILLYRAIWMPRAKLVKKKFDRYARLRYNDLPVREGLLHVR